MQINETNFQNNLNLSKISLEPNQKKATEAAKEFEALFASMMIRQMRKAMLNNDEENDFIPVSLGEKIFSDLLDEEYGKIISSKEGLGLADLILKQLDKDESNSINMLKSLKSPFWIFDKEFVPYNKATEYIGIKNSVERWTDLIQLASKEFNVDSALISAVIACESSGNQYAVSPKGAKGLMQLMDSTAKELGVSEVFNPKQNIFGGTKYLKMMLDKFNGDEKLALASYNAGPAAVEKYNGIPPFEETKKYVENVLSLKNKFSQLTQNMKESSQNE